MTSPIPTSEQWRTTLADRNLEAAKALISQTPVDHVFPGGMGVLYLAVLHRWPEGVTLLLEHGWHPLPDTEAHLSPMVLATALFHDMGMTETFLEHLADRWPKDVAHEPGKSEQKALISRLGDVTAEALRHNHHEAVALLDEVLVSGWNREWLLPHATTPEGVQRLTAENPLPMDSTLLAEAVRTNKPLDIIQALHRAGLPHGEDGDDRVSDALARAYNRPEVFFWLLDQEEPRAQWSPIAGRLLERHLGQSTFPAWRIGMVERMMDKGLDVSASLTPTNTKEERALFLSLLLDSFKLEFYRRGEESVPGAFSRIFNHPSIQEALSTSQTPFPHWLFSNHHPVIPHWIDGTSACPFPFAIDGTDDQGLTLLHLMASRDDADLVGKLLAWGADPHHVNHQGKTALDLALEVKNLQSSLRLAGETPSQSVLQALFLLGCTSSNPFPDELHSLAGKLKNPGFLHEGQTLLHHSMSKVWAPPTPAVIETLCGMVPINIRIESGNTHAGHTALSLAVAQLVSNETYQERWVPSIHLLLDHGADVNILQDFPCQWPKGNGVVEALRLRVEALLESHTLQEALSVPCGHSRQTTRI
jgi:hypothetical protein